MNDKTEIHFGDFLIDEEGVFYNDPRGQQETIHVCSRLVLLAMTRNADGDDWGKLFTLTDPAGVEKQYYMGNDYSTAFAITQLKRKGLAMSAHARAHGLLAHYLTSVRTERQMRSSAKLGWVANTSFVLPDTSFGTPEVVYSGGYRDYGFGTAGNWKANVGKFCSGNSRLIFAASAAFAAPLMAAVEMEGGGFHYVGKSSRGKSTCLEVAASIYGSAAHYLQNWDATKNSLEQVAEAHNDCLMVIDELGSVDGAIVGPTLYMIANGHGKSRMNQTKRRWRVLFLTSGEITLAEHMAEAGKTTKMGQEVRLLNITPPPGAEGSDLLDQSWFENTHSFSEPADFANHLKAATRKDYGTPLPQWLSILTKSRTTITVECRTQMESFTKRVLPPNATGEVSRAIRRFAIVAAAGEIATAHKVTGWKTGEAIAAAEKCFLAWMGYRRTFDPAAKAVDRVRMFIVENEGRFELIGGEAVQGKVGYKKKSAYLILPDVFRDEVCAGSKPEEVAEGVERAGYLSTSGKNRLKKQERIGGELVYVYSVSDKILEAA
jgi:putative DNA primase/helicase